MGNASGAAAVESEGELLEVALQVSEAHRSLMGAEDPSLEQREDEMNPRQHFGGGLIEARQHRDDVLIAFVAELGVAAPAIGVGNLATVEVALDEADQRAGGNIGKQTEPNPAAAVPALFHRGGDDRFLFGGPSLPASGPPR